MSKLLYECRLEVRGLGQCTARDACRDVYPGAVHLPLHGVMRQV